MRNVVVFGWFVLALVFLDELLAMAAYGVWGWQSPAALLLVWLMPLLAMLAWFFFASPKAAYGGPVLRPVVKVIVFGLGTFALWDAGHLSWAAAFFVFSVVVNGLAMSPPTRSLTTPRQGSHLAPIPFN